MAEPLHLALVVWKIKMGDHRHPIPTWIQNLTMFRLMIRRPIEVMGPTRDQPRTTSLSPQHVPWH